MNIRRYKIALGIPEKILIPKPFQTFLSFRHKKTISRNALKLFRVNVNISELTTIVVHTFWDHLNFGKALIGYFMILLFVLWLHTGVQSGYAQESDATGTPTPVPQSTASSSEQNLPAVTAVTPVIANTSTPAPQPGAATPPEHSPPGVAEVTFAQLGAPTFELESPIDQRSFNYSIPYRWIITGDKSYIELQYDLQLQEFNTASPEKEQLVNAVVNVYYNDILITSFTPHRGVNQSIRIPIPPAAVNNPDQEQHKIRFIYFSGDCNGNQERSIIAFRNSSFIHFEYELLPLEIDLADFPRPLIQELSGMESILLVLPDAYSDADLAAAASIAATMGQRTFNEVTLDLITASEVTPERLTNSNAIIIGQPRANTFLSDLYQRNRLPTILTEDDTFISTPDNQPISPNDGVLQEIPSEFSNDHVYLIVTGANDTAVTSAARALSVLSPRYGFAGNLVIVAEFRELTSEEMQAPNTFSLADFEFNDTTFYGTDTHSANVSFFIPSNWKIIDDPTLTLSYVHAATLQPASSGLTVNLNGNPVGSAPIDNKVIGERNVVIELANSDFEPGTYNNLTFDAIINMEFSECALPELDLVWVRINEASQLHLPHIEVGETNIPASLTDPFSLFISRQDLDDILFSLPENPTQAELKGMVQTAAWLGSLSGGPGFAPQVSRSTINDTAQLAPYHVIAFGRPTENSLIAQINEQLPQPFVPGENNLRQEVGNVVYRLSEQFSIGILQALPSPWNSGKAILVATGTTPEGVENAIKALTDDEAYYELEGDLAFINNAQIETFESEKLIRSPAADVAETMSPEGADVTLEEVIPTQSSPTTSTSIAITSTIPVTDPPSSIVPKDYSPPEDPAPPNILVFGLIGAGIVIVIGGGILALYKAKTR